MPPNPWPPQHYPGGPVYGADPQMFARRASVYMWILGAIIVLMGILFGITSKMMTPENIASLPQGDQILEVERQAGVSIRSVYMGAAVVCFVTGGLMGLLAFPVRGGSYGGTIGAIIFVGLVTAFLLLVVLIGLLGGAMAGPQGLVGPCMLLVPTILAVLAMTSLIKAIRMQSAMQMAARYAAMYGQPPGGPQGPQQPSAAQYWEQQRAMQHQQQWPSQPMQPTPPPASPQVPPAARPPASQTGSQFGPAPFGIPPPPDESSGRYGYATRPQKRPDSDQSTDDRPAGGTGEQDGQR